MRISKQDLLTFLEDAKHYHSNLANIETAILFKCENENTKAHQRKLIDCHHGQVDELTKLIEGVKKSKNIKLINDYE